MLPQIDIEGMRCYLIDIECNLGIHSERNIPKQHQRDAGKLATAMLQNDTRTARRILLRYQSELCKGNVSGGPKEIKPGNAIKRAIAHTAAMFLALARHDANGEGDTQ